MVDRVLTIPRFFAVTFLGCVALSSTASAQTSPVGARISAYAKATIVRPATLQVDRRAVEPHMRLSASATSDMAVSQRSSIKSCRDNDELRCELIVFDLP